jgi:hypothetical protein
MKVLGIDTAKPRVRGVKEIPIEIEFPESCGGSLVRKLSKRPWKPFRRFQKANASNSKDYVPVRLRPKLLALERESLRKAVLLNRKARENCCGLRGRGCPDCRWYREFEPQDNPDRYREMLMKSFGGKVDLADVIKLTKLRPADEVMAKIKEKENQQNLERIRRSRSAKRKGINPHAFELRDSLRKLKGELSERKEARPESPGFWDVYGNPAVDEPTVDESPTLPVERTTRGPVWKTEAPALFLGGSQQRRVVVVCPVCRTAIIGSTCPACRYRVG